MDKIKLKVVKRPDIRLNFFGSEIVVSPIISIDEQKKIKNACFNSMFDNGGEWDEYLFDFSFRYGILSIKTNIDFSDIEDSELEEIIWGEYYEKVSSSIVNYRDVLDSVNFSLSNEIKNLENKKSLNGILNKLVEMVLPMVEQFKNISPEEIEKLKGSVGEILEKVKSEPTVMTAISDMNGNKKRKVKKEKE